MEKCLKARKNCIASVIVHPRHIIAAKDMLRGSTVAVGSVIGISNVSASTDIKTETARKCVENGATELDFILDNRAMQSGGLDSVRKELETMMGIAKGKAHVRAVFEPQMFTDAEKEDILIMLKSSGVEYVKLHNAKTQDILCAKQILGSNTKLIINRNIKSVQCAEALLDSAVARIEVSDAFDIL